MAWRVMWMLECDQCKDTIKGTARRKQSWRSDSVEMFARKCGWKIEKLDVLIRHLCTSCAKAPPEWWHEPKEATS